MATRGKGSRNKGADYERKIAKKLAKLFGVEVKRTGAQESAKVHGGDINAPKYIETVLNDFFWELKCREQWNLIEFYSKASHDCGGSRQIPLVVAGKNYEDDYVFLSLDDFLKILLELEGWRREDNEKA